MRPLTASLVGQNSHGARLATELATANESSALRPDERARFAAYREATKARRQRQEWARHEQEGWVTWMA